MTEENKELTKKDQSTDLAVFEGSGAKDTGFEGTTGSSFKTPFLKVLQDLSPEIKERLIPDAKQGQFCNSATGQIYDTIDLIVLKVEHSLITWKPKRGGFVGRCNKILEETIVVKKEGYQKWDKDGNDIMDTMEFFCLNANDPSEVFVLALSATSFKHARSFATRLRLLKANGKPVNVSWAGVWRLATIKEHKDMNSWYTIGNTPEFVRFVTKEERDNYILPAKEMLATAETDYSTIDEGQGSSSEDVPF